ncbi:MAG: uracil-DNA glycosylase [Chrysiogenetes bacterium]|nr:uracil-DNA glycosylase [Chrysiogenetes bacterium]
MGIDYVRRGHPATPVSAEKVAPATVQEAAPVAAEPAAPPAKPAKKSATKAPKAPEAPAPVAAAAAGESLDDIRADIGDCTRCKLHTTRTQIVFHDGGMGARVAFVGEGPGKDEDLQGVPFVGRAGKLLTDIIEKGMGIPRAEVYICNVVKCRPTENLAFTKDRAPEPDEVEACSGFLKRQLRVVRPEVIVTLGNPATKFLLDTKEGITRLRGSWHKWEGIDVMPTFHPAYVLRNPPSKREVWADIQLVMDKLGIERPAR